MDMHGYLGGFYIHGSPEFLRLPRDRNPLQVFEVTESTYRTQTHLSPAAMVELTGSA